jgi:hypothetical protein
MSFIKSKHSGWTWELKRTPFTGGGGFDPFQAVGDAFAGLDQAVGSAVPGGWGTVAAGALALGTGGASLALDAGAVAAADGIAMSTYGMTAAEALDAGVTAEALGLPAAATAADVGSIAGTASAEAFGGAGGVAGGSGEVAGGVAGATEGTPFQLADGTMGSIQGGNIVDAGGNVVAQGGGGTSLGDILGYAKTGSQVVGGLSQLAGGAGKVAGGIGALQAGQQMGQYAKQADPFAQYRTGLAGQLNQLLQNPQTVTQTPGYQFQLSQGLQAQQAQQAAQGRLVSGGALLEAQKYGQGLASGQYQTQLQNLASLSGASQTPASGATAQAGLASGQLGGYLGGAQAIAGGLGQVVNPLQTLYSQYNTPSPSVT